MKPIFVYLGLALALFCSTAEAFRAGDRVLARWGNDGMWYPATVEYVDRLGLHITYDDGDEGTVRQTDLMILNWRVGTMIECNWHDEGEYRSARISQKRGDSIEVRYADNEAERTTVGSCRSE